MAGRENISVAFTPQQTEFLAACVASGRYQSTSEVVREALRLLQDQHARRQAEIERARELIREGADHLDRGEVVDGETFSANGTRSTYPDLVGPLSSIIADREVTGETTTQDVQSGIQARGSRAGLP